MAKEGEFPEVVAEARPKYGTTELLVVPNATFSSQTSTALGANTLYYFPLEVRTPITITQFTIEVTAVKTGMAVRVGIYRADKDWQPTSLVSDAGTISVGSQVVATLSGLSISLQEGRYLIAFHSESNPTLRDIKGGSPNLGPTLGSSAMPWSFSVSKTYAALADPGTVWDTVNSSSSGQHYLVFLGITP